VVDGRLDARVPQNPRAVLHHAPVVLGAGEPRRDVFGDVLDVRAHPMDRSAARIDSSGIDNPARFSEPAAR
jgi:hypothetical protein